MARVTPPSHKTSQSVDLREGYRVEVEPLILPAGKFGARFFKAPTTDKGRWKQVGHLVVADTPEQAANDLLRVVNEGLMPGVEFAG